jgi:two-component system sensor histidine kinase PilS (NtrC family)
MNRNPPTQDRELYNRIKTVLALRIVFLTGFIALILLFQQRLSYRTPIAPLSLILGGAYFLSAINALLLRAGWKLNLIARIQVAGDFITVAGILFATGGIESPFSFLYPLVIIATSVMLSRAATYLVASAASIAYGLGLDLEYYNIIKPVYFFAKSPVSEESGYVFFMLFVNIASYYSVAFLSSLLSHRLTIIKEQLAITSIDLMQLQAFHKNVVQNMGNGLITTDLDGKITSMNPAGQEITGYAFAECLHQHCYDILAIPALKNFFSDPNRFSAARHLVEGLCQRKDDQTVHIRLKISRLVDPDDWANAKGFICVFEDLTEIKSMEEKIVQAEQLAVVGRFSAGLAHEIRNPLASISGSIQVLSRGLDLEEKNRRLMDIVLQETERLNRIVSDFLGFAHPRKARTGLTDLTQLIQDVITLMKNSGEYHPLVRIRFEPPADHILLQCDEQQIKQLLWNLCLNGIQAMSEGGELRVRLATADGASPGGQRPGVLLTVEDEGGGIPVEKLDRIFDPFFSTKETGIGLGLARVRQIVERHDGRITVSNRSPRGARFTVLLPYPENSTLPRATSPNHTPNSA